MAVPDGASPTPIEPFSSDTSRPADIGNADNREQPQSTVALEAPNTAPALGQSIQNLSRTCRRALTVHE